MERGQETVIGPPAAGIAGEGAVLAWSLKGIAVGDLTQQAANITRNSRWKGGLIRGLVCAQELVIKYAIEGRRVSGRVGACEVSYGNKSSVVLGWRQVMSVMIGDPGESTWGSALYSDNLFSIHLHTSSSRRLSRQVRRYSSVRTPPSDARRQCGQYPTPRQLTRELTKFQQKGSAFHTGNLRRLCLRLILSSWTLLIKALGLALSVSSGLSLGKEGPLVHVSYYMSFLFMKLLFHRSEAQKRKILAAAAAAGVSVAFGSPLGGVLFGLEGTSNDFFYHSRHSAVVPELDAFGGNFDVMWRGFVTSVIAAVALQYVNPFKISKLVLFQVTNGSDTWLAFELVCFLARDVQGVLGSLLTKLNIAAAVYRRNSVLHEWPILEVTGVAAVTAAVSYLVVFLRVPASDLVVEIQRVYRLRTRISAFFPLSVIL
ncbi:voltage gated chloride channel-domain-containing protein [Lactarius indigo]|nr:voltage gated chloride channel-domain-containing protein [Lactarius indigo]